MAGGAMLIAGSDTLVPLPVSDTWCGVPTALSARFSVAVRVPVSDGVNTTLTVADPPLGILIGVVVLLEKSPALVPVNEIPEIVSVKLPILVIVTVCGRLAEPTSWLPKFRPAVLRLMPG